MSTKLASIEKEDMKVISLKVQSRQAGDKSEMPSPIATGIMKLE
jgi:hypothetical protein